MNLTRRNFIFSTFFLTAIGLTRFYSPSNKNFFSKSDYLRKILEELNYTKSISTKSNKLEDLPFKYQDEVISEGFKNGNLVNIDGWIFSESEVLNSI